MRRATIATSLAAILLATFVPTAPAAPKRPARILPAAQAITTVIPTVSINGLTFADALNTVANKVRVRMEVDWTALKAAGVERTSKVTIAGNHLTLPQVLDLLCAKVKGARKPLSWYVTGATIRITTQAAVMGGATRSLTGKAESRRTSDRKPATAKPARPTGTSLDFDGATAAEVVDFFRSTFRINIVAHWNSLESLGVTADSPVTLKITQPIPMSRALDLFVDTFNAERPPLQRVYWTTDRGVVAITTGEVLNSKLSTRITDVSDMLAATPNFAAPRVSVERNTVSGGSSSGSGSGLAEASTTRSNSTTGATIAGSTDPSRAQREQALMEIVRNSIGEDFWQPTGRGSIRIVNGKMIITQSKLGFMLMSRSMNGRTR